MACSTRCVDVFHLPIGTIGGDYQWMDMDVLVEVVPVFLYQYQVQEMQIRTPIWFFLSSKEKKCSCLLDKMSSHFLLLPTSEPGKMRFWGPHAGQTAYSCAHVHHNLPGCILIWPAAFQIRSLSFASPAWLQPVHHHPPAVLPIHCHVDDWGRICCLVNVYARCHLLHESYWWNEEIRY